jgi:hypothetical protein
MRWCALGGLAILLVSATARADEHDSEITHAPAYSLWAGARVTYMGYVGAFTQDISVPAAVAPGVAPEIEVGARVGRLVTPFVFFEHGFMGEGDIAKNSTTTTDFYGAGVRLGGADDVGLVGELAFGRRELRVNAGDRPLLRLSGFETFRLALGIERRISTLLTVEALANASLGFMTQEYQDRFLVNTGPAETRDVNAPQPYLVLGIGIGGHFDVFGK